VTQEENNINPLRALLLLGLILSGTYKPYGMILAPTIFVYVIPLLLVLAILDILFSFVFNKINISHNYFLGLMLLLAFGCLIIVSLFYSPSQEYKYEKSLSFLVPIIFFLYALVLQGKSLEPIIYPYIILLIPLTVGIILAQGITQDINSSLDVTDTFSNDMIFDYLALGNHLAVTVIFLNYFNKSLALQIFILILLFVIGARGPFLFCLLVLIAMNARYFFTFRFVKLGLYFFGISAIYFLLFGVSNEIFDRGFNRMERMFSDGGSALQRLELFKFAFFAHGDSFFKTIFGGGFGSFGIEHQGIDFRAYPHNIILEVFFELGVIGVLCLICFGALIYRSAAGRKTVFFWIFIFFFINSLKSSSLIDHWQMLLYLGLVLSAQSTSDIVKVDPAATVKH